MAGPSNSDNRWVLLGEQLAAEIRSRRKAAGLSQPRLAELIGYTSQYVSLAERPRRGLPSAELVRAIDDALGAEGALIAVQHEADTARKACRAGTSPGTVDDEVEATDSEPGESPDQEEVETTKRRKLITSAAAITFGASLDEPVARILAAAGEWQVPTRVLIGDVRHLRSVLEKVTAQGRRAGGGAVRHEALAALRWATAMRKSSSTPEVRRELATTAARLASLAAWATSDAGHHEPARRLSLLGLQTARESGDLDIRASVASGFARQEIRVGNWAGALDLVQLAFTAGEALTRNGIADLQTVRALAYARKPDTAQCRRCIGAATDTYQPDSVSNGPVRLRYFTPAQLEGELANARYDLLLEGADVGDRTEYRLALIDYLSTAFHQYPASRARMKARAATKLATLLYLEGEHRLAHQMAEEAISLAGQIRSAPLADDLRVLLRTLPPGSSDDDPALDLHRRVSVVLAEMT